MQYETVAHFNNVALFTNIVLKIHLQAIHPYIRNRNCGAVVNNAKTKTWSKSSQAKA